MLLWQLIKEAGTKAISAVFQFFSVGYLCSVIEICEHGLSLLRKVKSRVLHVAYDLTTWFNKINPKTLLEAHGDFTGMY